MPVHSNVVERWPRNRGFMLTPMLSEGGRDAASGCAAIMARRTSPTSTLAPVASRQAATFGSPKPPEVRIRPSRKNQMMLPRPPRSQRTVSKNTAKAATNPAIGSVIVTNGMSVAIGSKRRSSPRICCCTSAIPATTAACEPSTVRFPNARDHR